MGGRDRWGSAGPEASSVREWLDAMRDHHSAVCFFTITPIANAATGPQLTVKLVAQPGPGPQLGAGPLLDQSESQPWPNSRYRTLEALMFAMAVRMDRTLGREWWEQKELPF